MITKLTVFKEVHNSWEANEKRKAGEAWDLLCLDISEPAEHRMEEMLYYRLKPTERVTYWGKAVGKILEFGISKIRHGDNGGKATLIGTIIAVK
jgi:hypothetical protein